MKFLSIILKNIRRNLVRTGLTAVGTMILVLVVTLVWSVLDFLNEVTSEKSSDFKAVITERWQVPSQMPFAYADDLSRGAPRNAGDMEIAPQNSMTWQFFIGSIDPSRKDPDNFVFLFAMDPDKITTMMDELDSLPPPKKKVMDEAIARMKENPRGVILGKERLELLKKTIGDRFIVTGQNYKEIELEFEVVGVVPDGTRYDKNAFMNRDYLNRALDDYPRKHNGKQHPYAGKSLNLVWLRVPNKEGFDKVASQIMTAPQFQAPGVKVETASSGISTFLESYKDLLWGMRYLLSPAILVTLALVISNAISISVRERRMEIAVLKVLGFLPGQVMFLILGEALLIGILAGSTSAFLTYFLVNDVYGGLKFPIAFFPAFQIPRDALWWGPAIGAGTAFAGALFPSLSARWVKAAQVFSKVA